MAVQPLTYYGAIGENARKRYDVSGRDPAEPRPRLPRDALNAFGGEGRESFSSLGFRGRGAALITYAAPLPILTDPNP